MISDILGSSVSDLLYASSGDISEAVSRRYSQTLKSKKFKALFKVMLGVHLILKKSYSSIVMNRVFAVLECANIPNDVRDL